MMSLCRCGTVFLAAMILIGCSSKPSGPPPLKVYPITGILQVDGAPAENAVVTFHPLDSSAQSGVRMVFADATGKFAPSMYREGDGLPEGNYALTFVWYESKFSDKDRLKKAYSDPQKSEHKAEIKPGKNDLGVINLTTKAEG